ncbi:2'-5'-RNA ligase [Raoultella terrigena]|uniref:2'-5'-RNA ligase n=1 Tax=Raoultella terrigena TaxID=577 RepID=A0A4U9D980_RAOTE|nr:2'-5'-RNA ligase [Raoultella terrigena]
MTPAGRVAKANLHLTLAFLGEVSADKQRALGGTGGTHSPARLYADPRRCRTVAASRVVWLGTRQPPRGVLQLAGMLRAQAARSGCYQSPQPFHPHITLLRDARSAVPIPPPGFSWTFAVRELYFMNPALPADVPAIPRWNVTPSTRRADAVHPTATVRRSD